MVNSSILDAFYGVNGSGQVRLSNRKSDWDVLNQISLREFMLNTKNRLVLYSCHFGQNDCRREWKMKGTLNGQCLSFNANDHYSFDTSDK